MIHSVFVPAGLNRYSIPFTVPDTEAWIGAETKPPAGIEGCVVHEQGELKKAIDHALEDKEIGILLLTEKFGREYPELINKVKLDHKLPLIIEVPDRHGTGRKPDFITSYVNEAIGLKL